MSGIVGSNLNIKGSGLVAKLGTDGQVLTSAGAGVTVAFEDIAAGVSWQAVETGSTMTAVAGNGYPIDTSSNACTITLPASASDGDTIIFTDYARNWGTNGIVLDSNGLNYQGDDDSYDVEYGTDGQSVRIVYSGATNGWIPTLDKTVANVPTAPPNDNGIFGFGNNGATKYGVTNLVSNAGVVATDVSAVGTARTEVAATQYGGNKAIFGFGDTGSFTAITNLVSNAGVVASDTAGVGTAREILAACTYGGDKGIFGFGYGPADTNITNLVTNVGVVGTDVTGVGTSRSGLAACEYGTDKGIFGYGNGYYSLTNLVSNTGVVATDTTGVGQVRGWPGACRYSSDKGIFGYGWNAVGMGMTNLVSNTGVVGTDVTGVGTARGYLAACEYGGDKGIFGYGNATGNVVVGMTNLISNVGVASTDVTGVGQDRLNLAACSYN